MYAAEQSNEHKNQRMIMLALKKLCSSQNLSWCIGRSRRVVGFNTIKKQIVFFKSTFNV